MTIKPNRRSLITGAAALSAYAWLRKPTEAALSINNLNGFGVRQAADASSITGFIGTAEDSTDTTTYTFSSKSLSTAASNRQVIVVAVARGSTAISAMTVGGVSATMAGNEATTGNSQIGIGCASVPTGTTGDIVITGGGFRCAIAWYVVYGFSETPSSAPTADTSSPFTTSLTIATNGFAVGGGVAASGPGASSWTNLTEDVDADYAESSETYGMASSSTAGTSDRTWTPVGTSQAIMALAAYQPS